MYDEARKAIEFMLKADANKYRDFTWKDGVMYGPGMDYLISLTRYFGNGTEECDDVNNTGPNIEYDDFGLFLTTFVDYVDRSGDWDFYKKWNGVVRSKLADVTVHIMAGNNLIKADSGPWEHHMVSPKQYTFTSGTCARGLEMFAQAQKKQNLPYEKYATAAASIKQAIMDNMLVDGKYFKGNANDRNFGESREFWDGGTFEIFANGLIKDKQLYRTHVDAYNRVLGIKGTRPGYIRLESTDPYENQEWVFINMRAASAHVDFGNRQEAVALINHMTELASLNYNVLPEMISNKEQMAKVSPESHKEEEWCNCIRQESDQYIGVVPMVGFGAGAYIIALLNYHGF
jgi:GH15 family glucan-1,4-alpha-glucosidase